MSGYAIQLFLEKKWLNYVQTVETLIRCHILRSDLGLHCFLITLLGVFRLLWVKFSTDVIMLKNFSHFSQKMDIDKGDNLHEISNIIFWEK